MGPWRNATNEGLLPRDEPLIERRLGRSIFHGLLNAFKSVAFPLHVCCLQAQARALYCTLAYLVRASGCADDAAIGYLLRCEFL